MPITKPLKDWLSSETFSNIYSHFSHYSSFFNFTFNTILILSVLLREDLVADCKTGGLNYYNVEKGTQCSGVKGIT